MNLKALGDQLGLDEEEYREMLTLFIQSGQSDLEKMDRAVERADGTTAARAAHSLKGAAVSLGLNDFFEAAKQAEGEAKSASFEKLAVSVHGLRKAFERIEGYAKSHPA